MTAPTHPTPRRRDTRLAAIPVFLAILAATTTGARAQTVQIPDVPLQMIIREAVGVPARPLVESDLSTLTVLNARAAGVADLTGLEYCVSLQRADLAFNPITDLTPLAGLADIQWLFLAGAPTGDLAPLAALTETLRLDLSGMPVDDLTSLTGMTKLRRLDVSDTEVGDLAPIAELTGLERLDIGQLSLEDISPVQNLTSLTILLANENRLSDLAPLADLERLEELDLSFNLIDDASTLSALTTLRTLDVSFNALGDPAPLAALTGLETLRMNNTGTTDATPLDTLTSLETLEFSANGLSDVEPFRNLTALATVDLSSNAIADLAPLAANGGLGEGDTLDVRFNPLSCQSLTDDIPDLEARGVNVDANALCALTVSPDAGPNTGRTTIDELTGGGFRPGVGVRLTSGVATIAATAVQVLSSDRLRCQIDLAGATPGVWDVVVFDDRTGLEATIEDAFTVAIGHEAAVRHWLGIETLEGLALEQADDNGDGRVDAADVVSLILRGF